VVKIGNLGNGFINLSRQPIARYRPAYMT